MEKKETKRPWFWRWFLNNQVVTALLIILLILLIIFIFTKVSYLFDPIVQFLAIVGLPIILSGILYYILNPIVDFLEKKGVKRLYSIIGLFVLIVGLMIWGVVAIIPKIQEQTISFVDNFPGYLNTVERKVEEITSDPMFEQFREPLNKMGDNIVNSLDNIIQNVSKITVQGLGSFVGTIATVAIAVVTMPFILFYLLKDGKELAPYFIKFLPTKMRKPTLNVLTEMNTQVSSYIRGQLTVAFAVAIMFMVGFGIIGLDYAITLGIMAGFLNLIPYLGSFLAMVPAVFLGLVEGPVMLAQVLIVFIIEQTIEGRVVSPLVLGSQLSIHPVTILLVLLTAGKLFGFVGVVLGIPFYAAAKVVITHIFEWYKEVSSLYNDHEEVEKSADTE